jgi:hypothetical protein
LAALGEIRALCLLLRQNFRVSLCRYLRLVCLTIPGAAIGLWFLKGFDVFLG